MQDPTARAQLLQRLASHAIAEDRVELVTEMSYNDYLLAHRHVDMLLDTFPHSGATTTCEALWMGVPTLTLAGESMLSRQGASLLSAAGLTDWIAGDAEDFVRRAAGFAADLDALSRLRAGLRQQVGESALFDAAGFAAALQDAFRGMWAARRSRAAHSNTTETS